MNKSLLALLFFLVLSTLYAIEETKKPRLLLHFDMNGTIIAIDAAGGKTNHEAVMAALADAYTARWDDKLDHPISYSEYVNEYLLPNKSKQERHEQIFNFLLYLDKRKEPKAQQAHEQYEQAIAKLQHQKTLILSSFYALLEFLEMNGYDFSIIIRTFGKELDSVIKEIELRTHLSFMNHHLYFKNGLCFRQDSNEPIVDLYGFLKENKHVTIRDDWASWHSHQEKAAFGKPFPIDEQEHSIHSMFFDDNIRTDLPFDKNIVHPMDPSHSTPLAIAPLIQSHTLVPVNTLHAILDEDYYIKEVQQSLTVQESHVYSR